jgi:hypothetical protein
MGIMRRIKYQRKNRANRWNDCHSQVEGDAAASPGKKIRFGCRDARSAKCKVGSAHKYTHMC